MVTDSLSSLLTPPVWDDMFGLGEKFTRPKICVKAWEEDQSQVMKRDSKMVDHDISTLLASRPTGILS